MNDIKKALIKRELLDLVYLCLNTTDIQIDEIEENLSELYERIIKWADVEISGNIHENPELL